MLGSSHWMCRANRLVMSSPARDIITISIAISATRRMSSRDVLRLRNRVCREVSHPWLMNSSCLECASVALQDYTTDGPENVFGGPFGQMDLCNGVHPVTLDRSFVQTQIGGTESDARCASSTRYVGCVLSDRNLICTWRNRLGRRATQDRFAPTQFAGRCSDGDTAGSHLV